MKKIYLLDTSIVSEFTKVNPNETVASLYEERKDFCAISATCWQELIYGISRLPEGKRKTSLSDFASDLRDITEILPYDDFAAKICGSLLAKAERRGKSLPVMDCQIAATAIANGMVLVTRNVSDFSEVAESDFLNMENWFAPADL